MKQLLVIIILLNALSAFATESIYRDSFGFPICTQTQNKIYFFLWDPYTKIQKKSITFFEIKSYIQATNHSIQDCSAYKYLQIPPSEILADVFQNEDLFSEDVLFGLKQVSSGGHLYHPERSAGAYIKNHPKLFVFNRPEILTQLRNEGGDFWAQSIIDTWIRQNHNSKSHCENLIGSCDFYLCQENKNRCGISGYNLSLGYKYCSGSRFSLQEKMQSQNGKLWVNKVFSCLQKQNWADSEKNPSCESIRSHSLKSHPECYVAAGFCELPVREKLQIFNLIKKEIFTESTLTQGLKVIESCKEQQ